MQQSTLTLQKCLRLRLLHRQHTVAPSTQHLPRPRYHRRAVKFQFMTHFVCADEILYELPALVAKLGTHLPSINTPIVGARRKLILIFGCLDRYKHLIEISAAQMATVNTTKSTGRRSTRFFIRR